jgi:hypothetical protein
VDVEVGDALADDVVEGDERPRLPHRLGDRPRQQSGVGKQRPYQLVREVGERLDVLPRDQQAVPGEERPIVEERERDLVLEDHVPGLGSRGDRAERAVGQATRARAPGATENFISVYSPM